MVMWTVLYVPKIIVPKRGLVLPPISQRSVATEELTLVFRSSTVWVVPPQWHLGKTKPLSIFMGVRGKWYNATLFIATQSPSFLKSHLFHYIFGLN